MIPFSKPSITQLEQQYMLQATKGKLCGDGSFTYKAGQLLSQTLEGHSVLLTTSCTHALEMAALLCDLQPGDEVILPSYTFVSTANAFLLRGAKLVFCDVEPGTMNLDVALLPELLTPRTRVIVPVDYAGVSCDMDAIVSIAAPRGICIVEDAAQAVGSKYKGRPCGTLADYACYSFHETKNYVMGEGGALIAKDADNIKRAEIIREKGTDRSLFLRGEVDKYTWRAPGSSYLPSDVLAALLCGQLERYDEIMKKRQHIWESYHNGFERLEQRDLLRRPTIPAYAEHNAHMYYLLLPSKSKRDNLIRFLRDHEVSAPFHYIPLHSSPIGVQLGGTDRRLPVTEEYAERLVRLPLWADMTPQMVEQVLALVTEGVGGI